MSLIFLGPPGVGKGTQAQLTADHYAMAHVSTGNILREEIKRGTELGRQVEGILRAGELVSDDIVNAVVKSHLGTLFPEQTEFLFDGYPRTIPQADALTADCLGDLGLEVICVVNLVAPREELLKRLTGRSTCGRCGSTFHVHFKASQVPGVCDICGGKLVQRDDDNVEAVSTRLDAFARDSAPLIDYYRGRDLLVDVEAQGQIYDVQSRIRAIVDAL